MSTPVLPPVAARLYTAMGPFVDLDAATGYTLAGLCSAVATDLDHVESYAADTDVGEGWSPLLDITRCPAEALPYLAQFVGVTIPPGISDDQARTLIRDAPGLGRGTPAAIAGAARVWLTGSQLVTINERYGGDAYALQVVVFSSQVIDTAQLTAAVTAAVPAGIILTVTILTGWEYADADSRYTGLTYSTVDGIWSARTYTDMDRELP